MGVTKAPLICLNTNGNNNSNIGTLNPEAKLLGLKTSRSAFSRTTRMCGASLRVA